jgi:hypothetical protein
MPLHGEPNTFAYLALFLWVPVTAAAFHRLRPPMATLVCLLGGVMLLPEQTAIDPPLLPPIDKGSVAGFTCFLGCLWKGRARLRKAEPLRGLDLLFVLVLIGNVGTALTNRDPIVTGPTVRPALELYDAFALGVKDTLKIYLPFFLGRAMLRTSRDQRDLMRVLVIAGLLYSVLAWLEIRLSPQLHRWFWGFHQMAFSMTMRFGGYRPTIFMLTGLAVGIFFLVTAVAATARWRAGKSGPGAALYLSVVLLACKSTGAILYGMAVLPVVALTRRPRMWLPVGLALLVLLYPLLRGTDVFPTDTLVSWAEHIHEERALSLWFRFDQEDQLLERARERVVFGWGTYDRNAIFDPETGRNLSITDGDWIIKLGTRGLVGFVGLYGMLVLPLLFAARRMRRIPSHEKRTLLSGFALVSALMTVDLLPNGLFHFLPFFFAGALEGLSRGMAREAARKRSRRAREAGRARMEGATEAA